MPTLRFRYQTIELGKFDIHVRTLRDNRQFADEEGCAEALGISSANWPLFGIIWDSGRMLARMMVDYEVAGRSILEIGCGIGLASLVLNQRNADITATDYHPEVADFLKLNASLNGGLPIPFVRTSWDDMNSALPRFDLLIGSDLLYERGYAESLSAFIDRHAQPSCEVLIVDPGRSECGRFNRSMTRLGYTHEQSTPARFEDVLEPFLGRILRYTRVESTPNVSTP